MKIIPILAWNKGYRNIDNRRRKFMNRPWAQGLVLLVCVALAMLFANLPLTKTIYHELLETKISIGISGFLNLDFPKGMTVEGFVNDILMTVFFFVVGLEIRREVSHGELCSFKKAILPVIAAFGGVVLPAAIYIVINHGTAAASGWGIPTATDIAFAVCILTLLGDRIPTSLKVFLTALAIADDLIAILVVAIFYGGQINMALLLSALAVIIFTIVLNRIGEKHYSVFILMALLVWTLFYYAGIHSTMSGVVMAFIIPNVPRYKKAYFNRKSKEYYRRLKEYENQDGFEDVFPNSLQRHCLRRICAVSKGSMGLADRLEHALGPWVNFIIMPVFALANAGVEISDLSYFNIFHFTPDLGSVGMGIFLGLVIGKPLGITLSSLIAIKCKVAEMPAKADWHMLLAVACLGGIGFTMSLFVDTLSFGDQSHEVVEHLRDAGKIAVLMASVGSAILGTTIIKIVHKAEEKLT